MKSKAFLLALLLALVGLARGQPKAAPVPGQFVCPDAGIFPGWACTVYYYNCPAKGARPPPSECSNGLVWDPTAQTCNFPAQVATCNIGDLCTGAGLFPVPNKPCSQSFLNCPGKDLMGYVQDCIAGLYFDVSEKPPRCERKADVPACTCPYPDCKDGPGKYPSKDKTKYYICKKTCGRPRPRSCKSKRVFDPKTKTCVKAAQ